MKKLLLFVMVLVVIVVSVPILYLASGRPLEFSLGSHSISKQIVLGEGSLGRLDLTMDVGAKIQKLDDQLVLIGTVSNDELFGKINAGFQSPARSGYTVIAHSGDVEAKWRRLNSLEIAYTPTTNSLRVRANAKMRLQRPGVVRTTGDWKVSAEAITSVTPDGELRLAPKSLDIDNIPGELDQYIVNHTDVILIPLSTCLKDKVLRIRNISYPINSKSATVEVSMTYWNTVLTGFCLISN